MMTDLGMRPADAIHSATGVAAELLGIDDQVGTIDAGKLADIVALEPRREALAVLLRGIKRFGRAT